MDEKNTFLGNKDRATISSPSWKEKKQAQDDYSVKENMLKSFQPSAGVPKDAYLSVFFIFLVHGLGTLITWNMFITAKDYFVEFKLRSNNSTSNDLADGFMEKLTFASQIPNLLFNWLNVFVNMGGDMTKRIVYSILAEIIIFIVTIILAMVDSDGWRDVFFWITMTSVVLLNVANGVYQNTIYGMAARLPIKYTGAVVLGSNISGLFVAVVSIISQFVFTSFRTAAIYYFITALIVLLICFDTYFALPLNKFYRYYDTTNNAKNAIANDNTGGSAKPEFWAAFKSASPQLFNVFFTFFITISIFPSMHSDIKKSDPDFFISDEYFTKITCFLTFNVFAMLGSLVTSWIQWPSPKYLCVPVLLRGIFLPLFLFCNFIPAERTLPVLITNDWIYWLMAVGMSFSSGYLSSLGMMYASQVVKPQHQQTAGTYAAAMLITGIFTGVMFSFVNKSIVT